MLINNATHQRETLKAIFCNTSNQGGLQPPVNFKINALGMLIWYHSIAMGLFFPNTLKVHKSYVLRQNDVTVAIFGYIADLQWNIDQNRFFRQNNSKYYHFARWFAFICCRDSSTPHPLTLTAYPTPLRWCPTFFIKMTAKESFFSTLGENRQVGYNHPLCLDEG